MTDVKNHTQLLLNQLDAATARLSVDQLLSELQTVVERINFSHLKEYQQWQSSDVIEAQINILFEGEISNEMLVFVQWLRKSNLLGILIGSNGVLFLNYCIKKYTSLTEVRFVTPLPISAALSDYVRAKILASYPQGARMVFVTNPSLVAGFIIDDGAKVVDKSLRRVVARRLHTNIESLLREKVLHG